MVQTSNYTLNIVVVSKVNKRKLGTFCELLLCLHVSVCTQVLLTLASCGHAGECEIMCCS